jgi:hypothetical protein
MEDILCKNMNASDEVKAFFNGSNSCGVAGIPSKNKVPLTYEAGDNDVKLEDLMEVSMTSSHKKKEARK